MNKKILITGITGQDGALLAKKLVDLGYKVIGLFRRSSANNFWRLKELDLLGKIELIDCEINCYESILPDIVKNFRFQAIFHFAGSSFTGESFNKPVHTFSLNTSAAFGIFEAVKESSPESMIYIANTSEIFGHQILDRTEVNSRSVCSPANPYGLSHLANINASIYYRQVHNLRISNMILFNHESRYRGHQFLSSKIAKSVAEIANGRKDPIQLGNINISKDWGSAFEFVDAFIIMMQKEIETDITIGTGKLTSIKDLIETAFKLIDMQIVFKGSGLHEIVLDDNTGQVLAKINPKYFRKKETFSHVADLSELKNLLNYVPNSTVLEVIQDMITYELDQVK